MEIINKHKKEIASLCKELEVHNLYVSGSVASDIDVLVLFDRKHGDLFNWFFSLKERLEKLFGLNVDIVIEDSIRNPYFKKEIEATKVPVYG